jgi:hypothetical protein
MQRLDSNDRGVLRMLPFIRRVLWLGLPAGATVGCAFAVGFSLPAIDPPRPRVGPPPAVAIERETGHVDVSRRVVREALATRTVLRGPVDRPGPEPAVRARRESAPSPSRAQPRRLSPGVSVPSPQPVPPSPPAKPTDDPPPPSLPEAPARPAVPSAPESGPTADAPPQPDPPSAPSPPDPPSAPAPADPTDVPASPPARPVTPPDLRGHPGKGTPRRPNWAPPGHSVAPALQPGTDLPPGLREAGDPELPDPEHPGNAHAPSVPSVNVAGDEVPTQRPEGMEWEKGRGRAKEKE